MVFVGGLGFQRGQGEAAAAEHRRPGAVDDVAADGADVPLGPEQVAGAVGVGDAVPGEQLHDGDVQGLGQGLDEGDVGVAFGGLPLGDGFVADLEPGGQLGLGEAFPLPQPFDDGSCDVWIHGFLLLLPPYLTMGREKRPPTGRRVAG